MSGLRHYERDAGLPARAGNARIAPPSEEEVAELATRYLLEPSAEEAGRITHVDWETARWKPGVSLTTSHRIGFEGGGSAIVGIKRYADGKASSLAERARDELETAGRRVVLPERRLALWRFPSDRILSGLGAFHGDRTLARCIETSGLVPARSVRRRRTARTLLRYKPERRAVFRVDLSLRSGDKERLGLAARIHAPRASEEIVAARTALGAAGFRSGPGLVAHLPRHGILFEEWLDLDTQDPLAFENARAMGVCLAELHAFAAEDRESDGRRVSLRNLHPLFAASEELGRLHREVAGCLSRREGQEACSTWTHGDVHPDQLARRTDSGTWQLLDLDSLGLRAPERDLASWIADHLWAEEQVAFEEAAGPLLEGYGQPVDGSRLRADTAEELVLRAAAALRRLQRDAVDLATRALCRARDLQDAGRLIP